MDLVVEATVPLAGQGLAALHHSPHMPVVGPTRSLAAVEQDAGSCNPAEESHSWQEVGHSLAVMGCLADSARPVAVEDRKPVGGHTGRVLHNPAAMVRMMEPAAQDMEPLDVAMGHMAGHPEHSLDILQEVVDMLAVVGNLDSLHSLDVEHHSLLRHPRGHAEVVHGHLLQLLEHQLAWCPQPSS